MDLIDYIVVGSGCAGAMAAQTLIEAGATVAMLDVGIVNPNHNALVPDKDFLTIRKNEPKQYHYFMGEQAEDLAWKTIGKGAQITPQRKHMTELVEQFLPVKSESFRPLESLGYGGLGIGWGLQCWAYSTAELKAAGLNPGAISKAYEVIAERIGISATEDDAKDYTLGQLKNYQASPTMDRNHNLIYNKYLKNRRHLSQNGFILGRTPLALITQNYKGRQKYAYQDMDYYSDNRKSAWRPWITIDELKKKPNFHYYGNLLVLSFKEEKGVVEVHCLNVKDNQKVVFKAGKLILAASALGSARIVLRSLGKPGTKLPLLCNPYTYIPCLQPAMMGKAAEPNKLGYAQLSLFLDEANSNFNVSVASLYSYQSLMLFRIIRQAPLNFVDARIIMRYLMSSFVIMGVHHPDKFSPQKYLQLISSKDSPSGDVLKINYTLNQPEQAEILRRERKFTAAMRKLRTYPLKRVHPGYGASIHYAGTLPFSKSKRAFTLSLEGKLHGTKSVYVADSAGFNYLPARGLTFTLLANAHLTAKEALIHATK